MKIIYRGGYNKEAAEKSLWFDYLPRVKKWQEEGKKIALVTLAKPDNYYDDFINKWPSQIVIIDHKTTNVDWRSFDIVIIPGGDSVNLYNGLKNAQFSLKSLNPQVLLVGDSAGAYVLSAYFYNSPQNNDRGKIVEFLEGFNLQSKIITIGHSNSPKYTNDLLVEKVKQFAEKKGLVVLMLEENQEKLFEQ